MNRDEVIQKLEQFKSRLVKEVAEAYETRGSSFGNERFAAWRRQLTKFLDENLPGESSKLDQRLRHMFISRGRSESDFDVFWRRDGEPSEAYLDSLILDVRNDEFDLNRGPVKNSSVSTTAKPSKAKSPKVFVVHGHDELMKTKVARFIERLGFTAVILHEQASRGMTIIEKIETKTDVGFAIVLYTADDQGNANEGAKKGDLHARARQNVVFEHGYLIAKLGRAHVVPLVTKGVELPSDIGGVVYVEEANWQFEIAKEMKAAGYAIDFNKVLGS